eukprot:859036-Pleurochrysis_carterae.AAC.3
MCFLARWHRGPRRKSVATRPAVYLAGLGWSRSMAASGCMEEFDGADRATNNVDRPSTVHRRAGLSRCRAEPVQSRRVGSLQRALVGMIR